MSEPLDRAHPAAGRAPVARNSLKRSPDYDEEYTTIAAAEPLTAGRHEIRFVYEAQPGNTGTGTLTIDGAQVAQGTIDNVVLRKYSISEPFDVGVDNGGSVARSEYTSPFRFSDPLDWVRFDLGEL